PTRSQKPQNDLPSHFRNVPLPRRRKSKKPEAKTGQDVCLSDRARAIKQTPSGQGCAPTP
ncbi:TPA: hypothetical protein ACPY82_004105, partial [Yersinia enterocolitica]